MRGNAAKSLTADFDRLMQAVYILAGACKFKGIYTACSRIGVLLGGCSNSPASGSMPTLVWKPPIAAFKYQPASCGLLLLAHPCFVALLFQGSQVG